MAYNNFKPVIWSKYIQTELEKKCRLVEDCNTQFEGEAKQGGRVKILGIASVTIGDYNPKTGIGAPEQAADSSIFMDIDQAKYFNFRIDDIDRAQSVGSLKEIQLKDTISKMARVRDSFVASLAKDAPNASASTQVNSAANAKKAVDAALLKLRENDVDLEDEVVITVSPFFYQLFRDALTELKTNNDELIRRGVVGMYDNCAVKLSNNLYSDGTDEYMMVRTKNAIAFASGIDEIEAYRSEEFFADAIKGLNVYGGKIVRPKELYVIKAHK